MGVFVRTLLVYSRSSTNTYYSPCHNKPTIYRSAIASAACRRHVLVAQQPTSHRATLRRLNSGNQYTAFLQVSSRHVHTIFISPSQTHRTISFHLCIIRYSSKLSHKHQCSYSSLNGRACSLASLQDSAERPHSLVLSIRQSVFTP